MTIYGDSLQSGYLAATTALATNAPVMLERAFSFTGGANTTKTFALPPQATSLDAKLFISQAGTAATTDKITVSSGTQTIMTFSAIGSAVGILKSTTVGLGVYTPIVSACIGPLGTTGSNEGQNFTVTCSSNSQDSVAPVYKIQFVFSRPRTTVV